MYEYDHTERKEEKEFKTVENIEQSQSHYRDYSRLLSKNPGYPFTNTACFESNSVMFVRVAILVLFFFLFLIHTLNENKVY